MVVRVYIVDDSAAFVTQLGALLAHFSDQVEVVGSATSGRAALSDPVVGEVDLVLLDLNMPHLDGISVMQRLRQEHPGIRVVALTSHLDTAWVVPALRAGADGYLLKTMDATQLLRGMAAAMAGDRPVSPQALSTLTDAYGAAPAPPHLTPRERDVLILVAQGRANAEIARALHVSVSLVKQRVASLATKLGAGNRTQIVVRATEHGLVVPRHHVPG